MKGAKWGVYRMAREVAKKWGNKFVRDGRNKVYKSFSDVIETKEGRRGGHNKVYKSFFLLYCRKMSSHALQQLKILKKTLDGTILDAQSATKKLNLKMIFGVAIAKVTLIFQFQGKI